MRAKEILGFVLMSMTFITLFLGVSACGEGHNRYNPNDAAGIAYEQQLFYDNGVTSNGGQNAGIKPLPPPGYGL